MSKIADDYRANEGYSEEVKIQTPLPNLKDVVNEKRLAFGDYMRKQRRSRRLTMRDFAAIIGISESYAGLLERGDRSPSFETLISICIAFGSTPNDVLVASEYDQVAEPAVKTDYERSLEAGCTLLRGFSEQKLPAVCNVLKSVLRLENTTADYEDE